MNRQQIIEQIRKKGTFLCVGLDTDIKKIPEHLLTEEDPMFAFNKAIIDATAPYCVAYKPNTAFYESRGTEGWQTLERTVNYLRTNYPGHFIIADAKRGDIGNTSSLYARAFFENMGVDALTVAPYMGFDSVKPFMDYSGRWVILLALTSNPGSRDFQFLSDMTGTRLFEHVIETARKWGNEDQLMFVVGATQGAMFSEVRRVAPDNFLLVPGVGAQGGSLEEVAKWGMTRECGLLVNSSRGIIFADKTENFAVRAGGEARKLQGDMACLLEEKGII